MSGLILPWRGVLPRLGRNVFVAPNATIIGDVEIGDDSGIWFGCVLRGDVHEIRIGQRCNIQDGTIIHVNATGPGTWIGDDVTIGHAAIIHACRLETHAFVGMGAIVMDGAVVEGGALVAAGTLIAPGKRVPRGELWAGNPGKKMRDLSEAEIAHLPDTARRYVEYAAEYRTAL